MSNLAKAIKKDLDQWQPMGQDSKEVFYVESGEGLQVAEPVTVDYFPFPDARDGRIEELTQLLENAESVMQQISDLAIIGQSYPTGAQYRRIFHKCNEWLKANAKALED